MRRLLLALTMLALALPALAVQPDEILADPALEARAREITAELRCVVCRNESVDDSNADIARDIRLMVRERLVAGDTNEEAIQYMVDRFGEFVLLNPRATGANLILWVTGPVLLIVGLGIALVAIRRRKPGPEALSDAEEARLRQLLEE
ncbi:cytochrome C biogenesis protein CcdA [Pararhodobacter marinus]|uniref:Cytochrome c-type biogenesis protein n=1 Tax=Pararhodobacter marinus TaxID=2184063 RepID=A0A2U2CE76_9RHOB|nr:cytochrome c-type biogenesis protein [Pararhodobacter marinus]PWE30195.1 cytochrome C biogenesis protein CcdA [Pararhodobacter marinus]